MLPTTAHVVVAEGVWVAVGVCDGVTAGVTDADAPSVCDVVGVDVGVEVGHVDVHVLDIKVTSSLLRLLPPVTPYHAKHPIADVQPSAVLMSVLGQVKTCVVATDGTPLTTCRITAVRLLAGEPENESVICNGFPVEYHD